MVALGLLALVATAAQPAAVSANLPLYFEASSGQSDIPAQFMARGHDYQFLISPAEAKILLRNTDAGSAIVRMQFIGANPQAQIRGDAELRGKINYLTGNDPAHWQTGVATFAKVQVGELYPGINLVYYGNQQQLEYDFTIAPGANPDAIAIHFTGTDRISINSRGDLVLKLANGEVRQPKPLIYQTTDGTRKEIEGGYRLLNAHTAAFTLGNYDRTSPLVIDPELSYSTYFGGTSGETAWAVAVNTNDGSIYVTGETLSQLLRTNGTSFAFPIPGAFQTSFQGGKLRGDAFVARFNSSGTNLIYLTYLGGNADDGAFGIAVDGAGDAFVTGFTDSPNFPVTANAIQPAISGVANKQTGFYAVDAFVTELNPGGSNLIYSTYLGGSGSDAANAIALDSFTNAYVAGFTYSSNFPVTGNAFQKKLACTNTFVNANAFIAKIGPGGSNLLYSTYFGGSNFDEAFSIAVDSSNYVYVTGYTASTNFPNTNAFQKHLNGSAQKTSADDGFVAKFDPTGTNLLYSSFLGGTNTDLAYGIAVDNNGGAYVTGWTVSTNFPNTVGTNVTGLYSYVTTNTLNIGLATNVFLTKITNGTQAGIAWSVVFGGYRVDVGQGVAVDPAGNVFVVGSTSSTNFPCFPTNAINNLRSTNSGNSDVFVTALNSTGTSLLYSIRLGGTGNDFGYGIAVDPLDNAYIVGQTYSTNFPALNAYQTFRNGTNDTFLAKIILTVVPPTIATQPTNQTVAVGSTVAFSAYQSTNGTPPFFFQWQFVGTNLVGTNLVNGENISGATNNVLTISSAQTNNSGSYWLIITNYAGSVTSSPATLTLTNVLPVLTTQPASQTVGIGSTVSFAVNGTDGTPPKFLQWLKDGTNLTNGTNISGSIISGATNNPLTISNVQTNDSGTYWLVVTNPAGVVVSSNAILTVLTLPDFTSIAPASGTNGGFILSGIGGTNGGTYYVLTSSNLLVPLTNWTYLATNRFDSLGGFIFTNASPTNAPQEFYLLQLP